jgi:hypothetical protein
VINFIGGFLAGAATLASLIAIWVFASRHAILELNALVDRYIEADAEPSEPIDNRRRKCL